MDNQVRQHLYQLISDYGIDVAKDTRRLESLLKDYTRGQYKREVFLCVQAAREGVIEELQSNKHLPYNVVAARLTKQLHEDYGLDLHAAKWAVGSWVVVLGLTKKFPPLKPVVQQPVSQVAMPTNMLAVTPTSITQQQPVQPIFITSKTPIIGKLHANRYSEQSDDTIVDTKTGLHWMRFALGQSWNGKANMTEAKRYTWQEALNAAQDFNQAGGFAGYRDWRVPSIDELKSIVEKGKKPAINHAMFPATPLSLFWSSSSANHAKQSAWAVYFYGGSAYWYGKTSYYFVRLVRN